MASKSTRQAILNQQEINRRLYAKENAIPNLIEQLDKVYANVLSIVKDENDYETINLIQPILDKIDEVQNEIESL